MTTRTEQERDVFERSVQTIAEKARDAYALVDPPRTRPPPAAT